MQTWRPPLIRLWRISFDAQVVARGLESGGDQGLVSHPAVHGAHVDAQCAGGGRSGAAEVTQSSHPDRGQEAADSEHSGADAQDIAAGQPAQSSGATQASGAITPHSHDRTGGVEAAVLSGIETARKLYEVLLVEEAPSE